jgi:hypothetical protein
VTIASHGTWQEGSPLNRPFNLSDLSLASHRAPTDTIGVDARIDLLGGRIVAGFAQMASLPRYQDLPAYDGIRQLGPRQEAWSTIPLEKMVLVLCSYDHAYYENWKLLRRHVATALGERDNRTQHVARLVDLRRPQLVSQALYEVLRRCSACVTDWTGWSPSTFFELGARLAISPWGSVQVVDDQWIDEQDDKADTLNLDQYKQMREMFRPIGYRGSTDAALGSKIAEELIAIKQTAGTEGGHFIRSVVLDSLARVQEARLEVYQALIQEADSLHHAEQQSSTQVLFSEMTEAKAEQEDAALQQRIAAWLYLEHRVGAGLLSEDDPRKALWRSLADTVLQAMYASDPDDPLIVEIERRVAQ